MPPTTVTMPSSHLPEMPEHVVWLTGMPRSGTNWFAQIFASHPDVRLKLCPLFSYEFKNACDESSSPDAWRTLFRQVYRTPGEYLDQEYLRRDGLVPQFPVRNSSPPWLAIKSTRYHQLTEGLLAKRPELLFVAIVRNPCATLHSWLSNPLEFPSGADPMTEWRTGACRKTGPSEFWGFEDWKFVTRLFLRLAQEYPDRFLLVRNEDFVADAERQVRGLFDRLGLGFTDQTAAFLRDSHAHHDGHARSVFKAPATLERWRRELPAAIAAAVAADLDGTDLGGFLS